MYSQKVGPSDRWTSRSKETPKRPFSRPHTTPDHTARHTTHRVGRARAAMLHAPQRHQRLVQHRTGARLALDIGNEADTAGVPLPDHKLGPQVRPTGARGAHRPRPRQALLLPLLPPEAPAASHHAARRARQPLLLLLLLLLLLPLLGAPRRRRGRQETGGPLEGIGAPQEQECCRQHRQPPSGHLCWKSRAPPSTAAAATAAACLRGGCSCCWSGRGPDGLDRRRRRRRLPLEDRYRGKRSKLQSRPPRFTTCWCCVCAQMELRPERWGA
jgi:hypothetical protein